MIHARILTQRTVLFNGKVVAEARSVAATSSSHRSSSSEPSDSTSFSDNNINNSVNTQFNSSDCSANQHVDVQASTHGSYSHSSASCFKS